MKDLKDLKFKIDEADRRIRKIVPESSMEKIIEFAKDESITTYCKLENLLPARSFKIRGATNKALLFSEKEREKGFITASTGNHGYALSYALNKIGGKCIIYAPKNASSTKIDYIERCGAKIRRIGADIVESEFQARLEAEKQKLPYISPYNDIDIIIGQGTIGCEINRQVPNLDAVFVPLGGGGLLSGIAIYLKSVSPKTKIIACSPSNSKVMMESVRAGKILDLMSTPTFSDGTAGGIEENSITFGFCSKLVDEFVEVSEIEIAHAISKYIDCSKQAVEGASGVALASFLKSEPVWRNKKIAIVVSGGNIGIDTLKLILQK